MTRRIFIAVAALVAAAASMSAQPQHNDSLRTVTWSIYMQGGVSGFHGMRGENHQYDMDTRHLAPAGELGVMLYPRPWIRIGLGGNYTYMKTTNESILEESIVIPDHKMDGYTGELDINRTRIQNRNFTDAIGTDLTLGINFLEIWRERKCQWLNIWLYAGGGYMWGKNNHVATWAVAETFTSNDGQYTKSSSYVDSPVNDNKFNAFYVPMGASLEFDIIPQITLAAYGKYNYFPGNVQHSPTGMWTAGAGIRFNLVGKKGFRSRKQRINDLQTQVSYLEAYRQVDTVVIRDTVRVNAPATGLLEVDEPLSHFAVQIYAFRKYQHAPDDKIFFGDNPTIYKNNGLRRYVIFTGTYEEAKAKLEEVRPRYYDAFIVYIDDEGTVVPYKE